MRSNIFLPNKIKVGYQSRSDTYTQKLAYVIYYDAKGVLRKEKSWESWRSQYADEEKCKQLIDHCNKCQQQNQPTAPVVTRFEDLPYYYKNNFTNDPSMIPQDFNNEPIEGFVLNKKAGGYKSGWNHRQTYCRIYDPRGFEFEITIPNLLYILENTNSIKGKGLEGKFIYGWDGTDLVLIPEAASEYAEMEKFTDLQGLKLTKKDIIPSWKYRTKENKVVTYLGYFETWESWSSYCPIQRFLKKKHWFANDTGSLYYESSWNKLVKKLENNEEYPFLVDKLKKDNSYSPVTEYEFVEVNKVRFDQLKSMYQFVKIDGKYGYMYHAYTHSHHHLTIALHDTLEKALNNRGTRNHEDRSGITNYYELVLKNKSNKLENEII